MATVRSLFNAFTAVAASDELVIAGNVQLYIFGTFVGTIIVEEWIGGAWRTRGTYTTVQDLTLTGGSQEARWRARCSAYTSGTANVAMR